MNSTNTKNLFNKYTCIKIQQKINKNKNWVKFLHFSSILGKIPSFPVCSKFSDFSLTGKCILIFLGFPVNVGTMKIHILAHEVGLKSENLIHFNKYSSFKNHRKNCVFKFSDFARLENALIFPCFSSRCGNHV